MNSLLQKHGCANVFEIPEGLKELMADITREVLRAQPQQLEAFICNYLAALLVTREHGALALRVLEELCDCRVSISEQLQAIGIPESDADRCSELIYQQINSFEPATPQDRLKEKLILQSLLQETTITVTMEQSEKVCRIIRKAFQDYWHRKLALQEQLPVEPVEPWDLAAQKTIEIYRNTKPTFDDLCRATVKIQAAYRGYFERRERCRPPAAGAAAAVRAEVSALANEPPLDVAGSRHVDLGPKLNIVTEDQQEGAQTPCDCTSVDAVLPTQ